MAEKKSFSYNVSFTDELTSDISALWEWKKVDTTIDGVVDFYVTENLFIRFETNKVSVICNNAEAFSYSTTAEKTQIMFNVVTTGKCVLFCDFKACQPGYIVSSSTKQSFVVTNVQDTNTKNTRDAILYFKGFGDSDNTKDVVTIITDDTDIPAEYIYSLSHLNTKQIVLMSLVNPDTVYVPTSVYAVNCLPLDSLVRSPMLINNTKYYVCNRIALKD